MTNQNTNYLERLTTHRRALHQIPELDRHLPKTKQYLLSVLEQLNCKLTFLCDSGICAFFDRGRTETQAFRTDMDALPVQENTGCIFASRHDGKMHACGHDAHMAMVLTLAEYIDTQDELNYNVLLIFQPAEETLGGAEEICKSGIFGQYNVVRVFGIHMWPFLEAGQISTRPGAFMPRSAEINIDFYGTAAHGTAPYEGKDALYIAADYLQRVYKKHAQFRGAIPRFPEGMGNIPRAPESAPDEKTLIHIGKMESGYARNIVSDYTHLLGTVRAYTDADFQKIITLMKDVLNEVGTEYQCETKFHNSPGYPPVYNDPELYEEILPILEALPTERPQTAAVSGENPVSPADTWKPYVEMELPLVISEDYSFYGLYAPSVFFVLGTGTGIPLHSTNFNFDEKVLLSGFNLYKALLA